jgi:hypothetical protein
VAAARAGDGVQSGVIVALSLVFRARADPGEPGDHGDHG